LSAVKLTRCRAKAMSNRQYWCGTDLATHGFSPESEVEVKLTGRSSGSFNT